MIERFQCSVVMLRSQGSRRAIPAVLTLAFLALLAVPAAGASSWTQRQGTFEGYWSVSGTVHILRFMDSSTVASGRLEGNVTFHSSEGPIGTLQTECVAFADDRTGSLGRCVWTGPLGDHIYVELKGSGPAGFGPTRGTFIGGTGKFEGIQGNFAYEWNYSVSGRDEDASLDGYSIQMRGNYLLPG